MLYNKIFRNHLDVIRHTRTHLTRGLNELYGNKRIVDFESAKVRLADAQSKSLQGLVVKASDIFKYGKKQLIEIETEIDKLTEKLTELRESIVEGDRVMRNIMLSNQDYFIKLMREDSSDIGKNIHDFATSIRNIADPDKMEETLSEMDKITVNDLDVIAHHLSRMTIGMLDDTKLKLKGGVYINEHHLSGSRLGIITSDVLGKECISGIAYSANAFELPSVLTPTKNNLLSEIDNVLKSVDSIKSELQFMIISIPEMIYKGFEVTDDIKVDEGKLKDDKKLKSIFKNKEDRRLLKVHLSGLSDFGMLPVLYVYDFLESIKAYNKYVTVCTKINKEDK